MGHDVTIIANHSLDMSTARSLALDLSERLDAGIRFSFCFYNEENNDHYIKSHFILNESKPKHYDLMLEFINSNEFDPDLFFENVEKWSPLTVADAMDYDVYNFTLCKQKLEIDRPRWDWGRWWGFVQFALGAPYPGGEDAMREFRLGVREEVRRYGGDTALYFSDQGPWVSLAYDTLEKPFDELLEKLKKEEDSLWHLPSLLAQPPLANAEDHLRDYPIFWDDFSDLPE